VGSNPTPSANSLLLTSAHHIANRRQTLALVDACSEPSSSKASGASLSLLRIPVACDADNHGIDNVTLSLS
jgi:hypothetical protein